MSVPDPVLAHLLHAIAAEPSDELAWLALADRLEERGEAERAELTRLCRGLRGMPEDDERWAVEDRVRALVNGGVRPCVPEIVNGIGMRFALIPPGTFLMGSPEDKEDASDSESRLQVTLTCPFWMGVFPVTQAQYEVVMGGNPSHFSKKGRAWWTVRRKDTGVFPVESVSWEDAAEFCTRLSALPEEAGIGRLYRLPTEAQWERACRGGLASLAYHFGAALDKGQANFVESGLHRPCAVGSYPPNAFGLYDMHGNVWEWVADWYDEYPDGPPVVDPIGPARGTDRVCRGGCWNSHSEDCRSASAAGNAPTTRDIDIGFRVALAPLSG